MDDGLLSEFRIRKRRQNFPPKILKRPRREARRIPLLERHDPARKNKSPSPRRAASPIPSPLPGPARQITPPRPPRTPPRDIITPSPERERSKSAEPSRTISRESTPGDRSRTKEKRPAVNREASPTRDELPLDNLEFEDRNLEHFLEYVDGAEALINGRYRFLKFKSKFIIKNIRDSNNPAGLLLKIFDNSIDTARALAKKKLNNAGRIGIVLTNPNLEKPLNRPIRSIASGMNRGINVLREFKKANQSAKNGSLLDAPTTMEIMVIANDEGRGFQHCKRTL